jgi:hypothetical protein
MSTSSASLRAASCELLRSNRRDAPTLAAADASFRAGAVAQPVSASADLATVSQPDVWLGRGFERLHPVLWRRKHAVAE